MPASPAVVDVVYGMLIIDLLFLVWRSKEAVVMEGATAIQVYMSLR